MFIQKEISDVTNQLLDSSLRLLMQLLVQWKTSMNVNIKVCIKKSLSPYTGDLDDLAWFFHSLNTIQCYTVDILPLG